MYKDIDIVGPGNCIRRSLQGRKLRKAGPSAGRVFSRTSPFQAVRENRQGTGEVLDHLDKRTEQRTERDSADDDNGPRVVLLSLASALLFAVGAMHSVLSCMSM